MKKKWWMESFGYQIYIKSFYDTNSDGIGDLEGVYQKLDYLHELGVNLIWLVPFYKSPMDDNGYDVSDFYEVASEYGTLETFKKVLDKAKKLKIRVIIDLILNHTSDEHYWFQESRKSLDNPYREYYIWEPPRIIDGVEYEPTNWSSFFGGSCWKKDEITGYYFMKIFSDKMPDLNWKSENVRKEMIKMAKWWLDMGISGFRIDAASHLARAPFVDSKMTKDRYVPDFSKYSNLPMVHEYLKMLDNEVFSKYDIMTVGEVGGGASVESGLRYASKDYGQLDMVFNFDHNWCTKKVNGKEVTDVIKLKYVFRKWIYGFKGKGWNPLYWLNHDHPRVMSMYGDLDHFEKSAKMLANTLYFIKGTPFIYQGEEIGMTNYPFTKLSEFRDVSTINHIKLDLKNQPGITEAEAVGWHVGHSRDHARIPMQWNSSKNAGFTTGTPWINVHPNYKDINVESQMKDPNSIWHHYKNIINLKLYSKYREVLIYGDFEIVDYHNPHNFSYIRRLKDEAILVVNSFSNQNRRFMLSKLDGYEFGEIIFSNYQDSHISPKSIPLRPYEAVVLSLKLTK